MKFPTNTPLVSRDASPSRHEKNASQAQTDLSDAEHDALVKRYMAEGNTTLLGDLLAREKKPTLRLVDCSAPQLETLRDAMPNDCACEALQLSDLDIDQHQSGPLIDIVSRMHRLVKLSFSIGDWGNWELLPSVLEKVQQLCELRVDLAGLALTAEQHGSIASEICKLKKLASFQMNLNRPAGYSLLGNYGGIHTDRLGPYLRLFENNETLNTLDLSGSFISEQTFQLLSAALKGNAALSSLSLRNCAIVSDPKTGPTSKLLASLPSLRTLDLSGDNLVYEPELIEMAEWLKSNTTLHSVDLRRSTPHELTLRSQTALGGEAARAWTAVIEQNKTLVFLGLTLDVTADSRQSYYAAWHDAMEKNKSLLQLELTDWYGEAFPKDHFLIAGLQDKLDRNRYRERAISFVRAGMGQIIEGYGSSDAVDYAASMVYEQNGRTSAQLGLINKAAYAAAQGRLVDGLIPAHGTADQGQNQEEIPPIISDEGGKHGA